MGVRSWSSRISDHGEQESVEGETRGALRQETVRVSSQPGTHSDRAGAEGFKRHREAGGGSYKINLCDYYCL